MISRQTVAVVLGMTLALVGCRTVERAAAKDPQRCERDPTCTTKSDKSKDCATACVDNMDCMERCRSVTGQR